MIIQKSNLLIKNNNVNLLMNQALHINYFIPEKIRIEEGKGKVVRQNVLKESITIRLEDNSEIEKTIQQLENQLTGSKK